MPGPTRRSLVASAAAALGVGIMSASAQGSTPSASPQATDDVVWVEDSRDLKSRPWKYDGATIGFLGEVKSMEVAPPGQGFFLKGDDEDDYFFRSWLSVAIPIPDDDYGTTTVMVGFDDDPENVNEGVVIEVIGTLEGVFEGTNAFGGNGTWPFIRASQIIIDG